MYWHQYFSIAAVYGKRVYKEWQCIQQVLLPVVEKACAINEYTLNKVEQKKVLKYYPLLSVCANADNYAALANRSLNETERKKITVMSAMATLCDDLLDEEGWLMEDLFIFLEALQFQKPLHKASAKAALILSINQEFLSYGIPTTYWEQLRTAFIAQSNSIQQNQNYLTKEETLQISKEKNGQTSLLVASLMEQDWTPLQLKIIYQTGVMGQLMNDIFDTHKDLNEGIYTIVSKVNAIAELKEIYTKELTNLHGLIRQLNLPKHSQQKIINNLTPINAFGMVGLHRMAQIETSAKGKVDWKNLPRKALVFDMAFWSNRILYLKYMQEISTY